MEIRKITVNGNEYEFINDSRNTQSGFAHDTTLFKNGRSFGRATAIYYNRTWECYRYQTVMKKCIGAIINEKEEDYISVYKANNGIKRLTAEKRGQAMQKFYEQSYIKELLDVYEQLDSEN